MQTYATASLAFVSGGCCGLAGPPGETSCLIMCWAVLDLFLAGGGGFGLSELEYKQVGPMKIARSHRERTVKYGCITWH